MILQRARQVTVWWEVGRVERTNYGELLLSPSPSPRSRTVSSVPAREGKEWSVVRGMERFQ